MDDFDDAIAWQRGEHETFAGAIPEAWLQGRTAFGGLIAAIGLRAMRAVIGDERAPRTIDTAFFAPLGPGPAEARVVVLRSGRHVTQAEAQLWQGGSERARISGVFGAARASRLIVASERAAPSRPVDQAFDLRAMVARVRGLAEPGPEDMPRFTAQVELRWSEGQPPFSGGDQAITGGYCRHRTRASGLEALVALLDAWPAPALVLARGPVLASSVRWVTHVVSDMSPETDEWCWLRSHTVSAGDGYTTMIARLHAADGRLLLWGEQLVAVFDGA